MLLFGVVFALVGVSVLPETAEVPRRSPGRGPPFWKSRVLRRVCGEDDAQPLWGDLPA